MSEKIVKNKSKSKYASWHEDEREWWNTFGKYMNYQWALMPSLNKIVRTHWEREFTDFLFLQEGKLLDMGCGSGWLSLYFCKKGMSVLGIDVSEEQIRISNRNKIESGMGNVDFESSDLVYWDCTDYRNKFDSVFVNAFLHHLPACEIETILQNIAYILRKGGKCYLYEPLASHNKGNATFAKTVDFFLERLIGIIINKVPGIFNLWSSRYKDELSKGYMMKSPHEGPVDVEWIRRSLPKSLTITNIKAWHLYSLGFAMQVMSLNESIRNLYVPITWLLYKVDWLLLKMINWQHFSHPDKFILCSIKIEKK